MAPSQPSKLRGLRQKVKDKGRSLFGGTRASEPGNVRLSFAPVASSDQPANSTNGGAHASAGTNGNYARPIWLEAFDSLSDEEARCLIEACPSFQYQTRGIKFNGSKEGLANQIAQHVHDAREKRAQHHPNIKAGFEAATRILEFSKDFISSAAALNPYTAAAWTATSFILPLLLAPSEQTTEAVTLLSHVIHLVEIYRWYEENYADQADFRGRARVIYVRIYKVEIDLYAQFCDRNWLSRLGHSIKDSGLWSNHLEELQKLDSQCRDLVEAMNEAQKITWRSQEDAHYKRLQISLDHILNQLKADGNTSQKKAVERAEKQLQRLDTNYRGAKDQNPNRVKGTCYWFLRHPDFLNWRSSCKASLLWVSADPGCGKSVLSKFILEQNAKILSNRAFRNRIVCYFFFKDGIENQMKATKAIGALIHQVLLQMPELDEHIDELARKSDASLEDIDTLWDIFLKLINDDVLDGTEIICVIDALDECSEVSKEKFLTYIVSLFERSDWRLRANCVLKMIVTSRPYIDIEETFEDLIKGVPEIRLRGEEEHETIEKEIRLVIHASVESVSKKIGLTTELSMDKLKQALLSVENKTYLWLHLVLNYLRFRDGEQGQRRRFASEDELLAALKQLPRSVEKAYERMLDKSTNPEVARKLLHIVLAAYRPLTVREAFAAIKVNDGTRSFADLQDGFLQPSVVEMKNLCGLLIRVSDNKIYLIHQTAREFLVSFVEARHTEEEAHSPGLASVLKQPFRPSDSHLVMSGSCINILKLANDADLSSLEVLDLVEYRNYCLMHLFKHLRSANNGVRDEMWRFVCDVLLYENTQIHKLWRDCSEDLYFPKSTAGNESVLAGNGLFEGLKFLDRQRTGLQSYFGGRYAPLYLAVQGRYYRTCKYLLENGHTDLEKSITETQPERVQDFLFNPIFNALGHRTMDIMGLLLSHSRLWVHLMDRSCGTTSRTVISSLIPENFDELICKLVIRHLREDCDCPKKVVDMMRKYERVFVGPWVFASRSLDPKVITSEELLASQATSGDYGAKVITRDLQNALVDASANVSYLDLVKYLVNFGVDVDGVHETTGDVALSVALQKGQLQVIRYLLSQGASPHLRDFHGQLVGALEGKNYQSVRVFLEMSGLSSKLDWFHYTWLESFLSAPFWFIKLFLPVDDKFNQGQSLYALCLSSAIDQKRPSLIRFLLEKGADSDYARSLFKDHTVLSLASILSPKMAAKLRERYGFLWSTTSEQSASRYIEESECEPLPS